MKMTEYDKKNPKDIKTSKPIFTEDRRRKKETSLPVYTRKQSDANQMSWWQLCITTGKNYSTFHFQVTKFKWSPLEALKHRGERYNRVVMSNKDLCDRVGICPQTFEKRYKKTGDFKKSLLSPCAGRGVVMSHEDLCAIVGINPRTFYKRYVKWKDFKKALLTPVDKTRSTYRKTPNESQEKS